MAASGESASTKPKKTELCVVQSVIACLEGVDSLLKKEYIIVGSHYDHLGKRTFPTINGDSTVIYNGADDNASGVAGVMELAEKLVSVGNLKRSIMFVLFGAEEQGGLPGSRYFCDNFPSPLGDIKLMINMDMIGRMDSLNIVYVHTDSPNSILLKTVGISYPCISLTFDSQSRMQSDQRSFAAKNIPILYFTTGYHPEYHTPNDIISTINFDGQKKLLDMIWDFIVLKAESVN